MARPHPVVGITAKLTNVIGGIGYEAHVLEGLFVEEVELIATKVRNDARTHTLLLSILALLQHLLSKGFEETYALTCKLVRFLLLCLSVYLFRYISDAQYKGKTKRSRSAKFFTAIVSEVAVFHVVVANSTHLVYVAKAAVVVGKYQAFRTYYFARATSTKDTNALAE